jgi:sialate O-acetylesterase
LINEWRRKWSESSPTNSNFPFGFVQLAAFRGGILANAFSEIRWHQTADFGFVPNSVMQVQFFCVLKFVEINNNKTGSENPQSDFGL